MSEAVKFNRGDFRLRSEPASFTSSGLYVAPGLPLGFSGDPRSHPGHSLHWPPSARNFLFFFSLFLFFLRSVSCCVSVSHDEQNSTVLPNSYSNELRQFPLVRGLYPPPPHGRFDLIKPHYTGCCLWGSRGGNRAV